MPIYLVTLDVQKAFDVVHHDSLLRKAYNQHPDAHLWPIMEQNLKTQKVRLQGQFGDPFPVTQGVGQGKILSTTNYKIYVNDLMDELEDAGAGMYIGPEYIGAPFCADDVIMLALSLLAMQGMLTTTLRYSFREHYRIHPVKTRGMALGTTAGAELYLDEKPVKMDQSIEHLGVVREKGTRGQLDLTKTMEDRVSSANRTAYALMGAGFHGTNGISPAVTRKIYMTYVLPRLTYGLETLVLLVKHLDVIETYHRNTLRQLQSFPPRTATAAIYLLMGIPPIEALVDRAIASLLISIGRTKGKVYRVGLHQLATKQPNSNSWFIYAERRLARYSLDVLSLMSGGQHPRRTRQIITKHWERALIEEALSKKSLRFLAAHECSLEKPHPVWSACSTSLQQTRQAIVRAKLLAGVYTLQGNRAVFNQYRVNATCPLCLEAPEDREHFILHCKTLASCRDPCIEDLCTLIPGFMCYSNQTKLQLVLDYRGTDVRLTEGHMPLSGLQWRI